MITRLPDEENRNKELFL